MMVSGHESPSSTIGTVEEESGGRNQRGGRDRIYLIFRTANVEATAPYHGWSHRRSRSGEIKRGRKGTYLGEGRRMVEGTMVRRRAAARPEKQMRRLLFCVRSSEVSHFVCERRLGLEGEQ